MGKIGKAVLGSRVVVLGRTGPGRVSLIPGSVVFGKVAFGKVVFGNVVFGKMGRVVLGRGKGTSVPLLKSMPRGMAEATPVIVKMTAPTETRILTVMS